MNTIIAKKAALYSAILGVILAILGTANFLIGLVIFALALFSAPCVIFFMKYKTEIGFLDSQQGAALGALCGFVSACAFMLPFTVLINIIHAFKRSYYSYGLSDVIRPDTLWFFVILIVLIALLCALTNSVTGMGSVFLLSQFEKRPDDIEEIDIHID